MSLYSRDYNARSCIPILCPLAIWDSTILLLVLPPYSLPPAIRLIAERDCSGLICGARHAQRIAGSEHELLVRHRIITHVQSHPEIAVALPIYHKTLDDYALLIHTTGTCTSASVHSSSRRSVSRSWRSRRMAVHSDDRK